MGSVLVPESAKPAELVPQQASTVTNDPIDPSIEHIQGLCQEFLGRFQAEIDAACVATYEEVLTEKERAEREAALRRNELRTADAELASLRQRATLICKASEEALAEFRTRAEESGAPLIPAGILAPEEIERRVGAGLAELQSRLDEARREDALQVEAAADRLNDLRALLERSNAKVSSLNARLVELQELPPIARHLAAREEERRREAERVKEAIRFLRTAHWAELSRNRRITPRLRHIEALSRTDATLFDALVERLSNELDGLDSVPPAIAWSVIRAIDELGLQDLFPDLPSHRTRLACQARIHKLEHARGKKGLPGKIVSLASHWGARVAAS